MLGTHEIVSLNLRILTLLLTIFGLTVTPVRAAEPKKTALLLKRLDLASFRNSTGPRRKVGKRTPEQYGFVKSSVRNQAAVLTEADGSWAISLSIIGEKLGHNLVCFEDEAENGGQYATKQVLDLTLGQDGLYEAKEQAATADCPARPGQG